MFVCPTVYLDDGPTSDAVCRGASVVLTCITVSGTGYLKWKNRHGEVIFEDTAMVGSTGTLGNISLNITYTETIDEAHVYISTATLNSAVEEISINCTDGKIPRSQTVQIRSEFSTTQYTLI